MTEMNAEQIAQEVNAWLDDNWDPNLPLEQWRNILRKPESSLAAPRVARSSCRARRSDASGQAVG